MKYKTNIVLFLGIMTLMIISGCSYEKPLDKSPEEIRRLAYEYVKEDGNEHILNKDTAEVSMVLIEIEHQIMGKEGTINIQGREVCKVTFRTTNDDLLGPIRVYLDGTTYDILDVDFRF